MASSSDERSWKELEFPTLLQLLRPIEADWEQFAHHLLQPHDVRAIRAQCCQSNAGDKALIEAIKTWSNRTKMEHRTWRTLRSVAEKWGDKTLPQFLKDNKKRAQYMSHNIDHEGSEPSILDAMNWAKNSPLRVDWYGAAVELVGINEANAIQANHSGGGNTECLRKVLTKWWNTTVGADRSWQTIVKALEKIEAMKVADDITDKCST